MANFHSNRSERPRSSEGPQMHKAVCSKCGNSCMVPFKPTGNRPIFCNDCFKTEGNPRRDDRASQSPSDRTMYDAVCDTCGNRCQIPFQPRAGKPVYCSHCFEQREKEGNPFRERPQNTEQFSVLNAKLDKILAILTEAMQETATPEKEAVLEELVEIIQEEKPEKKVAAKKVTKRKATKKKA